MRCQHRKSRGAALISALFVTAIAAMLATAMAVNQRLLISQSELMVTSNQAYLDLQGIQDWAIAEITAYTKKVRQKQKAIINKKFGPMKFNDAKLTGIIIDEQGRFNINSLAKSANQPQFVELIQAVDHRVSKDQAFSLAKAVTEWLTKGGDDDYYFQQSPPYRAAHRQMIMVSELRAVQGFNAKLYSELHPYLTAIPLKDKLVPININTASAEVIATLLPKFNLEQAKVIVSCRQQYGGFINLNNFNNVCLKPLGLKNLKNVSTSSNYFILQSQANLNHQQIILTSFLVTAIDKKDKINVRIAWQSLN